MEALNVTSKLTQTAQIGLNRFKCIFQLIIIVFSSLSKGSRILATCASLNMLRTLVRRAHIHKQGFKFPDRKAPKESHVPHPHPAAPTKIVETFSHFQEVFESGPHFHPEKLQQSASASSSQSSSSQSSSSSSGLIQVDMKGREVAEDTHLLPERFWKTPALLMSEEEMEAIMAGGAH